MEKRCGWPGSDKLMVLYHDTEWGVPLYGDRKLFEFLVLDAMQAGLSWKIVLHKREGYRRAFHNFNPKKISGWTKRDVSRLLKNSDIIRNRLKIESAIINAQKFLEVQKEFGSFSRYIWQFTKRKTRSGRMKRIEDIPARSRESDRMSEDLKKRGFKFVGSTICYAFMQASGMVNDHLTFCFRHQEILKLQRKSPIGY